MIYKLPKPYLSYSAITLWLKNKEGYRARYYRNEPQKESIPMTFGKKIAEVLESRDYKEYPSLEKVPLYPISEHPLEVEIEGVKILAYLDLWTPETFTFGEVKTGSISKTTGPPWDKKKVCKHDQLPFYSLLIKKLYGEVNPLVNLIWLETIYKKKEIEFDGRILQAESHELELTGRIEVFERSIAEWERMRIQDLIIKCAEEIHNDYDKYIKESK